MMMFHISGTAIRRLQMHFRNCLFGLLVPLGLGISSEAFAQQNNMTSTPTYIPVISKGYQHPFWQAVKLGAQKAAMDYNVVITFEGPKSETMVDTQIDMLQTEIAKNPSAICFAALDSKAAIPLLEQAHKRHIPIV
jgi:ribose transport system substrate-binding protein